MLSRALSGCGVRRSLLGCRGSGCPLAGHSRRLLEAVVPVVQVPDSALLLLGANSTMAGLPHPFINSAGGLLSRSHYAWQPVAVTAVIFHPLYKGTQPALPWHTSLGMGLTA